MNDRLFEIQDGSDYSPDELKENLDDIVRLNRLSGAYRQVINSIETVIRRYRLRSLSVLDIGTGVADIPREIARHFAAKGFPVTITAVDPNPITAQLARDTTREFQSVSIVESNLKDLVLLDQPDIVLCHQTFHHLSPDERPDLLQQLHGMARYSLIMHDLVRSKSAYWLAKGIIRTLTKNRLSRFDGPQSILRSLTEAELLKLAAQAGIRKLSLRRLFPFRLALVTFH